MQIVLKYLLFCLLYAPFTAYTAATEDIVNVSTKIEDKPAQNVTTTENPATSAINRRSRQFFFQPSYVVVQNLGASTTANCWTAYGQPGTCSAVGSCSYPIGNQFQRRRRQLFYLTAVPTRQLLDGSCFHYDQFGVGRNGICCAITTDGVPTLPTPPNVIEQTMQNTTADNSLEDEDFDTETLISPDTQVNAAPTSSMSDEPIYATELPNEKNNYAWIDNAVRQYPFQFAPAQFAGFQWPPQVPTHPPTFGGWPPQIPTHPPNHQYPTHPPASSGFTTSRPITTQRTTTTTRRPSYPAYPGYPYPTYRPPQTSTSTFRPITTTTIMNDVSGLSSNGLPTKCGIKNPISPDQQRIVGGNNASPHEFPWIAVLFKSGKQFCGGSIITPNHILSAAHCVARMTPWDVAALTANLGDYNIRTDFEVKHVSRRIKRLVRHKGFDFSTLHNDISILTLSEPVRFGYEIQPICLPTSQAQVARSYNGYTATVVGWGSLRENGPQPSILQKVDIPVWGNSECAQKYGSAAPAGIISSMLCAGQAARDSCSGDSGGPLIINENGHYTQVGIVSWGIGCGKGQYPGVYTRVTSLLPWIYKNIK